MKKFALLVFWTFFMVSCKTDDKQESANAPAYKLNQTIYYGGDILTMEGDEPTYAEALVQREGKMVPYEGFGAGFSTVAWCLVGMNSLIARTAGSLSTSSTIDALRTSCIIDFCSFGFSI